jgi:uracil-DNA glycosylase family 4
MSRNRIVRDQPPSIPIQWFVADCRRCPRLARHLEEVRELHPHYHSAPVPPFGDLRASLLVVGLAPGRHGANATGRPFTGDYAGLLLYATLYRYGFSTAPESLARDDGLALKACRITNAVKCLPPQNKPTGEEVRNCNGFLRAELGDLEKGAVVLALGRVAHSAVLQALDLKQIGYKFGHGAEHGLPGGLRLLDSYHTSRYNIQTGRLSTPMFRGVVARARALIG